MSGSEPKTKISFNPTAIQFWAWAAFKLIALIGAIWAGMAFVADHQFTRSLDKFHSQAKPEIEQLIDTKIDAHRIAAEAPFVERMHSIENTQGRQDEKLEAIREIATGNTGKLNRMDEKIDLLLQRGPGG